MSLENIVPKEYGMLNPLYSSPNTLTLSCLTAQPSLNPPANRSPPRLRPPHGHRNLPRVDLARRACLLLPQARQDHLPSGPRDALRHRQRQGRAGPPEGHVPVQLRTARPRQLHGELHHGLACYADRWHQVSACERRDRRRVDGEQDRVCEGVYKGG